MQGYTYINNCINILDDTDIFTDATEMAQAIDKAIKINKDIFYILDYDLYFKYNKVKDIHYFYFKKD